MIVKTPTRLSVPGPLAGAVRLDERAGPAQHAGPRPIRRRNGLCAVLAGRAPQYFAHRELSARGDDRDGVRGCDPENSRRVRAAVMLPNHSPLKVAETFRMLEALHPGRIDLGIGRAPGTDQMTALALRRSALGAHRGRFSPSSSPSCWPSSPGPSPTTTRSGGITAIPAGVPTPPIWLLGSSDFSARLAAELGLGFAFAHRINPLPPSRRSSSITGGSARPAYFAEPGSISPLLFRVHGNRRRG